MKHLQDVIGSSFLNGQAISERVYSIVQTVEGAMSSMKTTVTEWNQRIQGRRDLARLSPRILADIGLTKFDVEVEVNKPFWKK
jgi:uncharacterized protein YjiS (DUF1127 family)